MKGMGQVFKKLWLKYGDYKKCLKELEKLGYKTNINSLKRLRYYYKLPLYRSLFLKNKKCYFCGKKATKIIGLRKLDKFVNKRLPICRKCANRLFFKRRYHKDPKKYIFKRKKEYKNIHIYLGRVICPICLRKGSLWATARLWLKTKHIIGFWFKVHHEHFKPRRYDEICYLGRDKELEKKIPPYLIEREVKKCLI
jgi:hypothetical protein